MNRILLAAAAAITLAATGGPAAAQYGYFPPTYANPYQAGYGPQVGYPGGGFGQYQPGYGQPVGGPEVVFVNSLYSQYLGRNPDPRGLRTWVNRLQQFGGDTNRLTQEFIQASQRELNSNNPYYPRAQRWR